MGTRQGTTPYDSLGNHKRDLSAAETAILNQITNNDGPGSVWAMSRQYLQQLFDPRRNLDDECGYPPMGQAVSAEIFRQLYDREPIANRVVEVMPKECWQQQPLIYESEDSEDATDFEKAWDNLEVSLSGPKSWHTQEQGSTLYGYLLRADILSRIGHYGVLLLGLDDGKDLQQPVDGVIELDITKPTQTKTPNGRATKYTPTGNRYKPFGIPDSPIHEKERKYLLNLADSEATYHEPTASTPIRLIKSEATIALNSQERAIVRQWTLERENLIANQKKWEEAKRRKEQEEKYKKIVGNNFPNSSHNPYAAINPGPIAGVMNSLNSLSEGYSPQVAVAEGYVAPYDRHPTNPSPNQRARDAYLPSSHGHSTDGRDVYDVMGLRINDAVGEWASEQALNVFCPTGVGGGIDATCGKDSGPKVGEGTKFISGSEGSTVGHLPGSMGIDRKDMPQIKTKDQKEFVKWAQKKGITITKGKMRVDDAEPTQHEFDQKRVDAHTPDVWADKKLKPVLVSQEGRVLDGTHHWLKHVQDDKEQFMPVIRIHLPAKDALKLMHSFPKTMKAGVAVGNQSTSNRDYTEYSQPNLFTGTTSWLDEPATNANANGDDEEDDDEDWEWATDDVEESDDEDTTDNANPEGCNQYKPCSSGGGVDALHSAFAKLDERAGGYNYVRLHDLRSQMPHLSREQFDRLVTVLTKTGQYQLTGGENRSAPEGYDDLRKSKDEDIAAGIPQQGVHYTALLKRSTRNSYTYNDAWDDTGANAPNSSARSTDAQYASSSQTLSGTDQQYFGVQFGPSEQMSDSPPPKGTKNAPVRKLLFLRPFDESLVQIVRYEWNIRNPRFGQPVMYRITLNDPREQHSGVGLPLATVFVHWSRIIHLADNLKSSEIFGVPAMRPVLNPILDIRKVRGASSEGYWKSCFAGLSLETNPTLGGDVAIDMAALRDMAENFQNGLQRWLALSGLTAKSIAPSVVDPTPYLTNCIEHICIQLGVPVRVFKGSERGELASSQDDASWNDRVKARQDNYVTPNIIKPFVDRLIAVGVLPEPKEGYVVEWPDLDSNTDKDKAGIALSITQAIAAYVSGQLESVMTFHDYLTRVLNYTEEAADAIVEAAQDLHDSTESDPMTMPPSGEQGHPATPPPPPPKPIIMGGAKGSPPGTPAAGTKAPPNPQDAKIAAMAKAQAQPKPPNGAPK